MGKQIGMGYLVQIRKQMTRWCGNIIGNWLLCFILIKTSLLERMVHLNVYPRHGVYCLIKPRGWRMTREEKAKYFKRALLLLVVHQQNQGPMGLTISLNRV
jgi:hypothetical protein